MSRRLRPDFSRTDHDALGRPLAEVMLPGPGQSAVRHLEGELRAQARLEDVQARPGPTGQRRPRPHA